MEPTDSDPGSTQTVGCAALTTDDFLKRFTVTYKNREERLKTEVKYGLLVRALDFPQHRNRSYSG